MSTHDPVEDLRRLERVIGGYGSLVTAFSGGVDSTLVAATAHRVLGSKALAVTGISNSLAGHERDEAGRFAQSLGLAHQELDTHEMQRPGYRANAGDRCYHCKSELFDRLVVLADERGFSHVASGTNVDDLGDYRPGLEAASERAVKTPLVEAGMGKSAVRRLAAHLGLPNHAKPAAPCLASRVPHGREVTPEVLRQIERGESAMRELGFSIFRVRHHGEVARLELPSRDMPRAMEQRVAINAALRRAGFAFVALDLSGFRSGSLNVLLPSKGSKGPQNA
jgi:uncharacterized protein